METLTEKFKTFCQKIDKPSEALRQPEETTRVEPPVKLYNIFKRSLPVGVNKLVFQNVTEEDVTFLFRYVLRAKTSEDSPVIYWDAVEVGTAEEWNVFSNDGVDITGNTGNPNTYRESRQKDVEWKD